MTTELLLKLVRDVKDQVDCLSTIQNLAMIRPGYSEADNDAAKECLQEAWKQLYRAERHLKNLT